LIDLFDSCGTAKFTVACIAGGIRLPAGGLDLGINNEHRSDAQDQPRGLRQRTSKPLAPLQSHASWISPRTQHKNTVTDSHRGNERRNLADVFTLSFVLKSEGKNKLHLFLGGIDLLRCVELLVVGGWVGGWGISQYSIITQSKGDTLTKMRQCTSTLLASKRLSATHSVAMTLASNFF
jgi:hypothetical protein